jgi:hypothetical protein
MIVLSSTDLEASGGGDSHAPPLFYIRDPISYIMLFNLCA